MLAPEIVDNFVLNNFATLIIVVVEIFRRSFWNYFKIEKKHLYFIGHFHVI